MAINETKERFGLKLLDYFDSILFNCKDSTDEKAKDIAFRTLMNKHREIVLDLMKVQ